MIDITFLQFDEAAPLPTPALDWLSPAELARAARFRHEADAQRYRVAHAALRGLLAQRLHVPPGALDFATDDQGKPQLLPLADDNALWHFNLSHAAELVAVALARTPVGIDVEREVPMEQQAFAQANFTAREQARLHADGDVPATFFQLWTAKEAVLKACGLGLRLDMRHVDVADIDTAFQPVIADASVLADDWQVATLRPAPGYQGAVASRMAQPLRIRHLTLDALAALHAP